MKDQVEIDEAMLMAAVEQVKGAVNIGEELVGELIGLAETQTAFFGEPTDDILLLRLFLSEDERNQIDEAVLRGLGHRRRSEAFLDTLREGKRS